MSAAVAKLLVPVDLSSGGRGLVDLGMKLGRRKGAELHLLSVVDAPTDPTTLANELAHEWLALGRVAEIARDEAGVGVERHVASGPIAAGIAAAAARIGIDLVVVPRTALHVLGEVDCPVLLVGVAPRAGFRRIVCAVDFSARSRAAMLAAARLARQLDLELELVHIVDDAPRAWLAPARRILAEWARAAAAEAGKAVATHLLRGRPAEKILEHARERKADLVVVAKRSPERASEGSLGDVATEVLRRATCPVLAAGTAAGAAAPREQGRRSRRPELRPRHHGPRPRARSVVRGPTRRWRAYPT